MVFLKAIHWIAGIFGSRKEFREDGFVKKAELDEIVKVVMSGFDSVNSRISSMDSFRDNFEERISLNESRTEDIFIKLDSLHRDFDGIVSGSAAVKDAATLRDNEELVRLRADFNNSLSEFKDSILVISYRSDGIPSEEEFIRLLKTTLVRIMCGFQ